MNKEINKQQFHVSILFYIFFSKKMYLCESLWYWGGMCTCHKVHVEVTGLSEWVLSPQSGSRVEPRLSTEAPSSPSLYVLYRRLFHKVFPEREGVGMKFESAELNYFTETKISDRRSSRLVGMPWGYQWLTSTFMTAKYISQRQFQVEVF